MPCTDPDGAEHELVDTGRCHVVRSLIAGDPADTYIGGPPGPIGSGAIQVTFDGEYYLWRYAPPGAVNGLIPAGRARRGHRIRLSRQRPLPPDARSVAAPTKWANPYRPMVRNWTNNQVAVELYEKWIRTQPNLLAALDELRGYDLACWCPSDLPCHADVLLKLLDEQEVGR